jgi:hypothetical protein
MTTIIECNCNTCETNANTIGKSLPLRAEYTAHPAHAGRINLKSKKTIHGLVSEANHPIHALREGAKRMGVVAI